MLFVQNYDNVFCVKNYYYYIRLSAFFPGQPG